MYIDSSSQRNGYIARLLSPPMQRTRVKCLQFWYHMYGSTVGSLSVYKLVTPTRGPRIWRMSGNLGDEWLVAQVSVWSPLRSYNIAFQASVGNGGNGDIAIDDVVVFNGRCASPGELHVTVTVIILLVLFNLKMKHLHFLDDKNKNKNVS